MNLNMFEPKGSWVVKLCAILTVLNFYDLVTTIHALSTGYAVELNPFGVNPAFKLITPLIACLLFWFAWHRTNNYGMKDKRQSRMLIFVGAMAITALYIVVVINNTWQLIQIASIVTK